MTSKYKVLIDKFFVEISSNKESEMIKMRNHVIETCDEIIKNCDYKFFLTELHIKRVLEELRKDVQQIKKFVPEDNSVTTQMILALISAIKIYKKGYLSTTYTMYYNETKFTKTQKVCGKLIIKKSNGGKY